MYQSKRVKAINAKTVPIFKNIDEIINFIKENANAKFDESIDLSIKLGVNPKKSDENVRGNIILSHGIPKKVKIGVFTTGIKDEQARKAGADVVGLEDLIEQIKISGTCDFDMCLATNDVFTKLLPIAKILGQSGIMPNNKDGTITNDIEKAITEAKSGKKKLFRNDSAGYVHIAIGKASFDNKKIIENIQVVIDTLKSVKPAKVKEMIKKIYISSTMGLGEEIPLKFL